MADRLDQHAEVWFDGARLQRALIRSEIGGTLGLGRWKSREAAERMNALLLDVRLDVPCGVLP